MLTTGETITIAIGAFIAIALFLIDQFRVRREWLRDKLNGIHTKNNELLNHLLQLSYKSPLEYTLTMDADFIEELYKLYTTNSIDNLLKALNNHMQSYFNHIQIEHNQKWQLMANREVIEFKGQYPNLTKTLFYSYKLFRNFHFKIETAIKYLNFRFKQIWNGNNLILPKSLFKNELKHEIIGVIALYYYPISNLFINVSTMVDIICSPYLKVNNWFDYLRTLYIKTQLSKCLPKETRLEGSHMISYINKVINYYRSHKLINEVSYNKCKELLRILYIASYLSITNRTEESYTPIRQVWLNIYEPSKVNELNWLIPKQALSKACSIIGSEDPLEKLLLRIQ